MSKKVLFTVLAALLVLVVAACSSGGDSKEDEQIVWRMITSWGRTDPSATVPMDILVPGIEAATNGRLRIEWADDPSAVPAFQQLEPLRQGIYDISLTHPFYHSEVNALAGAQDLVLAPYEDREACGLNQAIDANYQRLAGVKYFPRQTGLGNGLVLDKKITTANLSGLNIRVYPAVEPFIIGVGGSPVSMPITDVYSALDRGLVNGGVIGGGIQSAVTFSWYEVSEYVIQPYLGETVSAILVNLDSWNALPADVREDVEQYMADFNNEMRRVSQANAVKDLQTLLDNGMELVTLPDAEAKKWAEAWFDNTARELLVKPNPTDGPGMVELAKCVMDRAGS